MDEVSSHVRQPLSRRLSASFTRSESSTTAFSRVVVACKWPKLLLIWHLAWIATDLTKISSPTMHSSISLTSKSESSVRGLASRMADSACLFPLVRWTALLTEALSYWEKALLFRRKVVLNASSITLSTCSQGTGKRWLAW